jgi:hypothetical protein
MTRTHWVAGATAALLVGGSGLLGAIVASPASAEVVPVSSQAFSGYATGTYLQAGLLQAGPKGPRVVNADVAFAGAAVNSQGLTSAQDNLLGNEFQPAFSSAVGKFSYGRGSGVEVGLGENVPVTSNQLELQKAEAAAPADTVKQSSLITVNTANPLLYADAAHGAGGALWDPTYCILNQPMSAGKGYVADAQLLDTAAKPAKSGPLTEPLVATDDTGEPTDAVASSTTWTYLDNQQTSAGKLLGPGFAVNSVVKEDLLPVTLLKGTANEFTIKVAGTWTLRAVAGGVAGSTYYSYAPPGNATPTTPLVQVWQGGKLQGQLTLQDLLGNKGISIDQGITIHLGTPAVVKRVGDNSITASVDVVRVTIPSGKTYAGDIAVGHMEASATVPTGGVNCQIPITKVPSDTSVPAGTAFTYKVNIYNPPAFNCTLDPIVGQDQLYPSPLTGATALPTFSIDHTTTSPAPDSITTDAAHPGGSVLHWSNLGPVASGASKSFTIGIAIPKTSPSGTLTDLFSALFPGTICKANKTEGEAHIFGVITSSTSSLSGSSGGKTVLTGSTSSVPTQVGGTVTSVGVHVGPPTAVAAVHQVRTLAFTGGTPALPIAALVLIGSGGGLLALRRFRLHH